MVALRPSPILSVALLSLACAANPSQDGGATSTSSTTESSSATTDSSSSESSQTQTETEDDDSTDFVPHADAADEFSCDPFSQDCPEDEKCVPYDSDADEVLNSNKCVPVLGDGNTDAACVWDGNVPATDDCDAQNLCYFLTEDRGVLVGDCTAFCTGSPDFPECPGMLSCYSDPTGSLNLCVPTCDPLVQDCDGATATCQWGSRGVFVCVARGPDAAPGEACEQATDCAAGGVCVDGASVPGCASETCCTSFCELGMMGACDDVPGTTCEPFFTDEPPVGAELVGVCLSL